MKLINSSIAKVKREAAGQTDYFAWDDALPGFGLRVRNGRSTWIVQYKFGPVTRRITLGTTEELTADQARRGWTTANGERRDGADKILVDARSGFDAKVSRITRRKEASHTLGATIGKYLEAKRQGEHKISENYDVALTYHLEVLLKPLHGFPLGAITRKHVAAEVDDIADKRGAVTANRARGSLSAFFHWAITKGLCDVNPVIGTEERTEKTRDRVLIKVADEKDQKDDWSEIVKVWTACPDNDYGRIVRLLILTGCRREEIGSLEWQEIDLVNRKITLPPGRTKNNKEHVVPLSKEAIAIIESIPRRDRVHVFGIGPGGYAGWSKGKANIDKAANLKTPWTIHDLRRTCATGMANLGVLPHVIEAVINHISGHKGGVAGIYNRSTYASEKRAALDLWASHVMVAIAQANGANVTALRKA